MEFQLKCRKCVKIEIDQLDALNKEMIRLNIMHERKKKLAVRGLYGCQNG